jgi:hypothetical protein
MSTRTAAQAVAGVIGVAALMGGCLITYDLDSVSPRTDVDAASDTAGDDADTTDDPDAALDLDVPSDVPADGEDTADLPDTPSDTADVRPDTPPDLDAADTDVDEVGPECDPNGDGLVEEPSCVTGPVFFRFVNATDHEVAVYANGAPNAVSPALRPGAVAVIGPVEQGSPDFELRGAGDVASIPAVATSGGQRYTLAAYRDAGTDALAGLLLEQPPPDACEAPMVATQAAQLTTLVGSVARFFASLDGGMGWFPGEDEPLESGAVLTTCSSTGLALALGVGSSDSASPGLAYETIALDADASYHVLFTDREIIRIDNHDRVVRYRGFRWFFGPQNDIPEEALQGWRACHREAYDASETSVASLLEACSGNHLMLACRPEGAPSLQLLAHAPRSAVTRVTPPEAVNEPFDANGSGWYFNDSYSWGFARQGVPLDRNSCDWNESPPGDPQRLCWHTGDGNLRWGWRCGANTDLGSGWERVVYDVSL